MILNGTSRKNNLKLNIYPVEIKLAKVGISSCSNTGSIRDDRYWTSRKNSLKLIELS